MRYTYSKYRTKRSNPKRTTAIILAGLAVLGVVVVVWQRTPKKNTPVTNQPVNATQTNTNTAIVFANTNKTNSNANTNQAAAEPIAEVTNPSTMPVETLIGTPKELSRGKTDSKQVTFTFDAGSGNQSGEKILAALKLHKIKATFFVTGVWAGKNPDLLKKISAAGHEVFNHTYSHPHLTTITDEEIKTELNKANATISQLTGKTTKPYFRPPYGDRNAHVLEVAAGEGYRSVFWTIDALDWKESEGMTAAAVQKRIIDNLKPGTIYLMHVGDTITGNILSDTLDKISNAGYTVVSLSQAVAGL